MHDEESVEEEVLVPEVTTMPDNTIMPDPYVVGDETRDLNDSHSFCMDVTDRGAGSAISQSRNSEQVFSQSRNEEQGSIFKAYAPKVPDNKFVNTRRYRAN